MMISSVLCKHDLHSFFYTHPTPLVSYTKLNDNIIIIIITKWYAWQKGSALRVVEGLAHFLLQILGVWEVTTSNK